MAQKEQVSKDAAASVLELIYQDIFRVNSTGKPYVLSDEEMAAKFGGCPITTWQALGQLEREGRIRETLELEDGQDHESETMRGIQSRKIWVTDVESIREMNGALINEAQDATDFFLRFMARGNELTIPYWLMQVSDFNWNDKMLLVAIVCNYDADKLLKLTNKQMADAFNMSERTVSRSLNHLESRGLIKRITTYYGERYGRFIIPNIPNLKLLISPMKAAA